MEVANVKVGFFFLSLKCRLSECKEWCVVTDVYGPMDNRLRSLLWNELEEVRALFQGPWCIGGDSNAGRFALERIGHSDTFNRIEDFTAFVDDNALVDIPLVGSRFTWSHGSLLVPSMSKIDRVLLCLEWETLFPRDTFFSLS